MQVSVPIHQRIDYTSKIVGVIFVAVGVDRLRADNTSAAVSFLLLGAVISLIPFFIGVKK
jgi:hypothetical protein